MAWVAGLIPTPTPPTTQVSKNAVWEGAFLIKIFWYVLMVS